MEIEAKAPRYKKCCIPKGTSPSLKQRSWPRKVLTHMNGIKGADGRCEHRRGASLWTLHQWAAWCDGLAVSAQPGNANRLHTFLGSLGASRAVLGFSVWSTLLLPAFTDIHLPSTPCLPHFTSAVPLQSTFLRSPSRSAQRKQNVDLESFEILM